MRWLLLLVAACSRAPQAPPAPALAAVPPVAPDALVAIDAPGPADASTPDASAVTAPARAVAVLPATACPFYALAMAWWTHELFPGCAPMPYANLSGGMPGVCGADCPQPCQVTVGEAVHALRYDARGRWLATREINARGPVSGDSEECAYTYEGDRMASCTRRFDGSVQDVDTATRDDRGRIITLVPAPEGRGPEPITVAYDASGNVARLVTGKWIQVSFDYDKQHRLIAEHETERKDGDEVIYRYDREHLVERSSRMGRTVYRYDRAGRLVAIEQTFPRGSQTRKQVTSFEYDALGRLTREVERDDANDPTTLRSFAYSCP